MSDQTVRDAVGGLRTYEFETTPFTQPKPLHESRVAIITSAGLRPTGDADWAPGDMSFTVLPGDRRDFTMAHFSPNFDRTGYVIDSNVVLPIDRLNELAAAHIIGSVATNHISFMGAQIDPSLEAIRLDSGPAAAKLLLDDEVDLVLLTPV